MPPLATAILGFIQLALAAVPVAEKVYAEARKLILMLWEGGIITLDQQLKLMEWADAHEAATLAGQKPSELVIDPDPVP
jgi:hypothetical protein